MIDIISAKFVMNQSVELRLRCDCRTGQVNGYVLTMVSPGAKKHLIAVIGFTPVNYNS